MNGKPSTRGGKMVLGATLLGGALMIGGATWLGNINAEPKIDFPSFPKPPSPNGIDFYIQAKKAIKDYYPPVARGDKSEEDLRNYSLARRDAWLRANRAGFAIFDKALTLPCYSRNPLYKERYFNSVTSFADLIATRTKTRAQHGDWKGAVQSGLDTIQMGIDIPRGGPLMDKERGYWCVGIGARSLAGSVSHLNAAEAKNAAARLEKLCARRVSFGEAMETERWCKWALLQSLWKYDYWRQPMNEEPTRADWVAAKTISKKRWPMKFFKVSMRPLPI